MERKFILRVREGRVNAKAGERAIEGRSEADSNPVREGTRLKAAGV